MSSTNIHTIKQGDTAPAVEGTVYERDGVTIQDLTGATVTFSMSKNGSVKINNAVASVANAPAGLVQYSWAASDTDTPGDYDGEFRITFASGLIERVPNNKNLVIRIVKQVA